MQSLSIVPPLARSGIDRDAEARRDPNLFDALLEDPSTRIIPIFEDRAPVADGRLLLLPAEAVTTARVRAYLGRSVDPESAEPPGSPLIVNVLSDSAFRDLSARLPRQAQWAHLRDVGGDLGARDAGVLVEALALARWHANYGYCPRCGLPTVVEQGGWARRCPSDGYEVYPRIDPAIIVAVRDRADRLLLGGGKDGWYSVLAGFVEAGESVEAAVAREVLEEAGLSVTVEGYLGSQSWPYPLSLMLAFTATVDDEDPDAALRPDGDEITHLEWFTREQLLARRERLRLPGTASIARVMIEAWLGRPIVEGGVPEGSGPVPTPEPNAFLAGSDIP